jgi:type IV secretory pathway VirB2 component (pilin)
MVSRTSKVILILTGVLAAILIIAQLVMGLLIIRGRGDLVRAHQHSGYLAVGVALLYIASSIVAIAAQPARPRS